MKDDKKVYSTNRLGHVLSRAKGVLITSSTKEASNLTIPDAYWGDVALGVECAWPITTGDNHVHVNIK